MEELECTDLPKMATEQWRKNYSEVEGFLNLRDRFVELRDLGYHPFRTYDWVNNRWYISDNGRPPAIYLDNEEAAAITIEELVGIFQRWIDTWVWESTPDELNTCEEWCRELHGKYVKKT